mmetsp:Transcript_3136/g.5372  ORF Transcript_3136/g.5372 Transcript_3136/m.5372 type:complete len:126 (+) Transcript_3136:102-479(+)
MSGHEIEKPWSSGCCGCFDDCGTCVIVCCLGPCITYGQNVDRLKGTGFCGPCCAYCVLYSCGCPCFIASGNRTEIRKKYGLAPSPMSDCLMHFPCCSAFAVCQETRELAFHIAAPGSHAPVVGHV